MNISSMFRRGIQQRLALRRGQRGASLLIALVSLAGISAAAVALIRSVDTGNVVAGNLAFKQSAQQEADRGLEAAARRLQALLDANATEVASDNYSPIFADTEVPADLTKDAPATNVVSNDTTGNTTRFFIERMCTTAGPATDATCLGGRDNLHFRITTRVDGPRNTFTLAQATFGLEPAATVARRAWRSVNL